MSVHRPVSEEEFTDLVRSFRRAAFHLEAQPAYALGYEREEFTRYLQGIPRTPDQIGWWQAWLDRMRQYAREGRQVSRVRILSEPPTPYQRWLLWAHPWHAETGEIIRYMPRSRAERIGLPLGQDWWLLDDERVLITWFTPDGEIRAKILTDKPGGVAQHRIWRDLAMANADRAERVTAA